MNAEERRLFWEEKVVISPWPPGARLHKKTKGQTASGLASKIPWLGRVAYLL
jgi:hypothetical protein